MSAVASVEFQAINVQALKQAFAEVGQSAQQSGQQVQQASKQLQQTASSGKSVGQSMNQIGQNFQFLTLNAFNLATSLINTKRSYEDLAKGQNTLKNATDAVTKATLKHNNAVINLKKAQSGTDQNKITKAQNAEAISALNLDRVKRGLKFTQIEVNRAEQDFYLNIIPNVISGLGTMFGLLQVTQGAGGIGGIIKGFGPLALAGAGIAAVFLAIKTNFLGFRDALSSTGKAVGDALPFLKPFLTLLEPLMANASILRIPPLARTRR